jgi:hypothetical protein
LAMDIPFPSSRPEREKSVFASSLNTHAIQEQVPRRRSPQG